MPRWDRNVAECLGRGLAIALTLVALGCSGDRTVRMVLADSVSTLDPQHHNEGTAWSVQANVYDALVSFSSDLELRPALAVSWESVGGNSLRFHLRDRVVFHDGAALEAADVVATYERAQTDPLCAIRHQLVGITRVVAEDARTVRIDTAEAAPALLNRLVFLRILPRKHAVLATIDRPIGTGSYRFAARDDSGAIDLVAFDGWHGRPRIPRIRVSFIEDDRRRLAELTAGRADLVDFVPPDDLAELSAQPGLRVELQPSLAVRILVVNSSAAPGVAGRALADPRVRRAMLMAMNRLAWAGTIVRGSATVATQYVHPSVFGFDPTIEATPFDPPAARRLLAEAGVGKGFEATLGFGRGAEGWATALAADLARVGIKLQLRVLPFPTLMEQSHARTLPLMLFSRACTTGDASEFLDSSVHTPSAKGGFGAENYGGFSNLELDRTLEAANRENDLERRRALLQHAQRLVLADLPVLPLVVQWSHIGLSSRIEIPLRNDGWLLAAGFRWRSGR